MTSKKGMKTLVTLIVFFFLIVLFFAFYSMFKRTASSLPAAAVDTGFSSVKSEFLLNNFLRTPIDASYTNNPYPALGENETFSDLISWTCDNENDINSALLEEQLTDFFDKFYGEHLWAVWIVYSNEDIDKKTFGNSLYINSALEKLESDDDSDLDLLIENSRLPGFASQAVPCKNKAVAKILFAYSLKQGMKKLI